MIFSNFEIKNKKMSKVVYSLYSNLVMFIGLSLRKINNWLPLFAPLKKRPIQKCTFLIKFDFEFVVISESKS